MDRCFRIWQFPLRYVLNIETVQAGLSSSYFFCHNNLALLPKKRYSKTIGDFAEAKVRTLPRKPKGASRVNLPKGKLMGNPKHGPFEGCVYFNGILWLTGPAEIIAEKKEANLM